MLNQNNKSESLPWQDSTPSFFGRFLKISTTTFQFLFYLSQDKLTGNNSSAQIERRAKWLVRNLLNLGPTFIKIGQALSTRIDLIPLEYIQELGQLQDQVPPFDSGLARSLIESELNSSIDNVFLEFEALPIASASLGQVHKARLNSGEGVVIKVQRPGLEQLFNLDFIVLRRLISFANHFLPWLKKYDLKAIHDEFFGLLFQEIDYILEGENADRFRANFKNYPQIKVPLVYWQYTTHKILTLEYLPGIKIDQRESLVASGINPDKIIQLGICSYLKQILEDGFFQSDPHPGNMAVSKEDGHIIFYDFGTMAEVKSMNKEQMVQTFFAVLRKDTDTVLETLVYMGLIEPVSDMTPVKRMIAFLLDKFRDKPVDIKAFEEISQEMYDMFEQQPFRLPPEMSFVLKSISTLDGIARALDPQYNLLAASQPFVKSLAASQTKGSLLTSLAKQATLFLQSTWGKPSNTELLMKNIESRLSQGDLQVRVRSLETDRLLKRIYLAIKTLVYACLMGFSLLSAILLASTVYSHWAIAAFSLSGLWFLFFLRSLISLNLQERIDKLVNK